MTQPLDKLELAIAAAEGHDPAKWAAALRPFMQSGGITSSHRIGAFVGQVSVESAGFAKLEENLWYHADRIMAVWPSRFDREKAEACEGNPEALANAVYCNRLGNGDEASGDGWRYRGAGLIQLTGQANQMEFAKAAGVDADNVGDYLRTPKGAAQSAVWFWNKHDLNHLADAWCIDKITRAINGGSNGSVERARRSLAAMAVLPA